MLREGLKGVKRAPLARALQTAQRHDYMDAYVEDLPNVVDIHAIRAEGIRIGADPLGGASVVNSGANAPADKPVFVGGTPMVVATWGLIMADTRRQSRGG